ncbi:MAG: YihY/virulence factor BrkB family protein [Rhodospirillaceae bacterium]|jgi:membrane protein|nr:YihY/virulence factor BrkB family protein [Rhodospirillaceae bacterium]MBT5458363.1 YihY/virulence factor BrkB family protein [Rhodospirillaceae bacterium]
MRRLSDLFRRIHTSVWDTDLGALPFWYAAILHLLRAFWASMRDLRGGELSLRAMSLVYTTILSIVPFLAISFSVLKGFGVHEQLETTMMAALLPLGEKGVDIGIRIVEFVENVKVGVLGSVGLALLLYTVISLMQKIERAFNFIWHVATERAFAQRFSDYLSVIVIGPVLVFASLGISASLLSGSVVTAVTAIEPFGTILHIVGRLLPFALVVAAFTFIYVFMPNTKVRLRSAFAGALIAGLLWLVAGKLFTSFVIESAQYTAIYSAFAALIVFMLWLYFAWLVLLIGASFAFYHQNPRHVSLLPEKQTLSVRMVERLSFALLAEIAGDFMSGDIKPNTETLARRLHLRADTAAELITALAAADLIVATNASPRCWLPARAPNSLTLIDAMAAIRSAGENAAQAPEKASISAAVEQLLADLDQDMSAKLAHRTLADLVRKGDLAASDEARVATLHPSSGPGGAAQ